VRLEEPENAKDVAGAVRALRRRTDVDPERIGVVGAGIGASAAAWLSFLPAGPRCQGHRRAVARTVPRRPAPPLPAPERPAT